MKMSEWMRLEILETLNSIMLEHKLTNIQKEALICDQRRYNGIYKI